MACKPVGRALCAALAAALLAACGAADASRGSASSPTPTSVRAVVTPIVLTDRVPSTERTALLHLAGQSPSALLPRAPDGQALPTTALTPGQQAAFDAQLADASAAASRLATPEAAAAAGYVQASTQLPGIGTHWVDWSLVDQPFDAAHPAMLLFDQLSTHEARLAGLSYWLRAADAPEGFIGPNDHWHRHSGMCFEDGWLAGEDIADAATCGGQYLEGSDLWMLHTWVVPGYANGHGVFAPRNSDLCPPDNAQLPDSQKCSSPGNPPAAGSHDDPNTAAPNANAYCHLPVS